MATELEMLSKSPDFSRYANVNSLLDRPSTDTFLNSIISTSKPAMVNYKEAKYKEHVYCNQKTIKESTLPPYIHPPDYATFMQSKKMAAFDLHGRHTSHHSESLVSQRVKDSNYENLKSKHSLYGNVGLYKQEPGFTS